MKKIFFGVLFVMLIQPCLACKQDGTSWDWSKDGLINAADSIVVATVSEAKETGKTVGYDPIIYHFQVDEVIKGSKELKTFEVKAMGKKPDKKDAKKLEKIGRAGFWPSCDLGVTFFENEKYVIFLKNGSAIENKFSFERFKGAKDKWVKTIKSQLSKQ